MMANLYPPPYAHHHQLDFHPRPVNHSPSPLGFGFGLATSTPSSPFSPGPLSPHTPHTTNRPQKRRFDSEEEDHARRGDEMDRSPTPERPRRAAPKRLRVTNSEAGTKENDRDANSGKDGKRPSSDVDVGVLLASLPQQSLLPLLMALIREKPDLKPTVLSLLPRPTLETALRALGDASKSLRDAYPYSAPSSIPSTTFGFGSTTFGQRPSNTGFGSFSRGATPSHSHPHAASSSTGGMRESYIISRLRPHISDFVSTSFSYLPYFSYLPPPSGSSSYQSSAIKPHAAETFTFLSTLTSHVLSQPSLARNELFTLLSPRLQQEWKSWVDRVDEVVNREGGMFSGEAARGWERSLDEFAEKDGSAMKEIRDLWVSKVGWLVGRRTVVNMDEDEDL